MFHADPTFRALLLSLAESDPPDLGVLPVLADWLEERGDGRAGKVRELLDLYSDPWLRETRSSQAAYFYLILFPEGPRWTRRWITNSDGKAVPSLPLFVTPRGYVDSFSPLAGPLWPDPPA